MANSKDIEKLKQGKNELAKSDLSGLNFQEIDLCELQLSFCDLSDTNLTGANLSDIALIEANLTGANLTGANLSESLLKRADLTGAILTDTNLKKADLKQSDLSLTKFMNSNLGEARLSGTNLTHATFINSNLRNVDLSESNLISTSFTNVDLAGASLPRTKFDFIRFIGCNLDEVNFSEANFIKCIFHKCDLDGSVLIKNDLTSTIFIECSLRRTILVEANLSKNGLLETNLTGANLKGANLRGTNLLRANLTGANLTGANLTGANLTGANLTGANLTGANLTGACIRDWNINSNTNFTDVICEYIYLKPDQQERRPSNPNQNFALGEFIKLVQKSLETVDLIFVDGIDWKAFLESFNELKTKYGEGNIAVQAIEKKSGGAFIIRLEVPPEVNKADIETQIKELYEYKLNLLEVTYHKELKAKDEQIAIYRQHNTSLENIINGLANRPIQNIINVTANSRSESMTESYQSKYDQRNSNNQFVDTAESGSNVIFNQTNYTSEQKQSLAEAAAEIQKLLKQLEATNPNATESEQIAYLKDNTTPSLRKRAFSALQGGTEAAIDEFILENKFLKVGKAVVKSWLQPDS